MYRSFHAPAGGLALVAALAGCASGARDPSYALETGQGQVVHITGTLTYRERVALPPGATAVVELRSSASETPVAEQRIDLTGRQVPVAFDLAVDRARLAGDTTFVLRGSIQAATGRWATDAVPVTPDMGTVDLGTLRLTRVAAADPEKKEMQQGFRATGNEPGWLFAIAGDTLVFDADNGATRIRQPLPRAEMTGEFTRYRVSDGGRDLVVTIRHQPCTDSMSGMPRPATVVVEWTGRTLNGCGGAAGSLLEGAEWVVEDLDGRGVIDRSRVTLNFAADGRISGRASCNQYSGQYRLTGEALTVSPRVAVTRMACIDAAMAQERKFLDLLARTSGFSIGPDGALILRAGDRPVIRARRQ